MKNIKACQFSLDMLYNIDTLVYKRVVYKDKPCRSNIVDVHGVEK